MRAMIEWREKSYRSPSFVLTSHVQKRKYDRENFVFFEMTHLHSVVWNLSNFQKDKNIIYMYHLRDASYIICDIKSADLKRFLQ